MKTKKFKNAIISLFFAVVIFASLSFVQFGSNINVGYALGNTEKTIAYTFEDPITVDGALNEPAWFIDGVFGVSTGEDSPKASVGYLWDKENLYVGILQSNTQTVTVKVNGVQSVFNIDLAFTTNELSLTVAKKDGAIELSIPFSSCDLTIDKFDVEIPVEITLSNQTGTTSTGGGNVVILNGGSIYIADSCVDYTVKGYTEFKSGTTNGVKQGQGSYLLTTDSTPSTVGFRKTPTFPSGNLDYIFNLKINELPLTNDNFASRGFYFVAGGVIEKFGFSLTKGADGVIYANVLYGMFSCGSGYGRDIFSKQCVTSIKEGDTVNVHLVYTGEKTNSGTSDIDLFIDGQYVHTFKDILCENPQWSNQIELAVSNNDSALGIADVELLDYMVIRTAHQNAVQIANSLFSEKLAFNVFGGTNVKESRVMTDLSLPTTVKLPVWDTDVSVSWKSSRPDVLSNDGVIVSRSANAQKVKLIASAVIDGKKFTHTYNVVVSGYDENGKVMFLEHDLNPYTGVLLEKGNTDVITFDRNLNSIGFDQGSLKEFNEILLKDTDNLSKIEKEDLSVYISDDNVTYTRIKDWNFFRTSEGIIISNINRLCRYVKVHCHFENDEYAGFTAPQQEMLYVYYNQSLPGNNGGTFTKVTTITSMPAESSDTDVITYVSLADVNHVLLNCREDYADVRFVMGDKILPAYYDGDGFYVRVFETVLGQTISIDIYGENENAISVFNMEGVFDAVYGNKTVYRLQTNEFTHNIAVGTAPNGDVLAIANQSVSKCNLLLMRSTDGGRTWTDTYTPILDMTNPINQNKNEGGGFLTDPDANGGTGRIFYHYFLYNGISTVDTRIIYSDDNGYTWSDPCIVNTSTSGRILNCICYSDGIKVSTADGDGPNVDYVFPAHRELKGIYAIASTSVYSRDGGVTWRISDSEISYEGKEAYESGNSESAIVELANGDLRTIMRCQYEGVYWFSTSVSYDKGVTWVEESTLTNIATPNTLPVLKGEEDGNVTLMWGGNNFMGGTSYQRYPMTLAYSDDQMQTWKQKLNLFSQTSHEKYGDDAFSPDGSLIVQPSLTKTSYQGSDDAYVSWWNFWYGDGGILIEDFHDMLYKTKGAADEFETTSSKYEGWVGVWGDAKITNDVAKDGNGSLKIDDSTALSRGRVNRSVPAMTKGSVSFDIMFEQLKSGLLLELKSAYVDHSELGNMVSVQVMSDGGVYDINPQTKAVTYIGNVNLEGWINVTVNFDVGNFTAELVVDGVKIGNLSVNTDAQWGTSVTNVQICNAGYQPKEFIAYVDNFIAYNGVTLMGDESVWTLS